MPEGTVLPAFVAAPAKLAAAAAPERADSGAPAMADGTAGAESFGQVLQSRMSAREDGQNPNPPDQGAPASSEEPVADAGVPVVAGDAIALQAGVLALLQQQQTTPVAAEGMAVTRELDDVVESSRGDRARSPLPRLAADEVGARGEERALPEPADKTSGEFRDLVEALGTEGRETRMRRLPDSGPQDMLREQVTAQGGAAGGAATSAAAANAAAAQPATPANGGGTPRMTLTVPVSSPSWGDAFSDRMALALQNRQPVAELHLNPPNLGPVEIQVSMNGDQASLSFFSPHAPVREAIQSAMPRLTEALAESGVSLGNVFVGAQSQQERNPRDEARGGSRAREDRSESVSTLASPAGARWSGSVGSLRTVDLFA